MYTRLAGLQYKVVYKHGSSNLAAGALSRHPVAPAQLQAISFLTPSWLTEVVAGYDDDPTASKLLQQLSTNPKLQSLYSLTGGLIRYKGRVWLDSNKSMQRKVMLALHNSALGGHSSFPMTHARIKKLFAWRGMKSDIHDYVSNCSVCLQTKPNRVKYPGLLSPLLVPFKAW
jgi:hypothetical protein